MKHKLLTRGAGFAALAAALLVTGCAQTTPPLYQWTAYQPEVYAYFKGKDSPQQQIDALEKALQQIRAKGHVPPPGFHAHLGMLYASVGNDQQAMQEFSAEERQFPESTPFMDFLMKKPKQTETTQTQAQADAKQADAKQADAKQADAKQADAKQADAKQTDAKQTDAKQTEQ